MTLLGLLDPAGVAQWQSSSLPSWWCGFDSRRPLLLLSMNPNTGSGGTCYGDSGGPHFIDSIDPNLQVSLTVTGDAVCKATDLTFRLDTPEAREFLSEFVTLP